MHEIFKLPRKKFEITKLVAQAKTNKQIADILGISVRTVEKHMFFILLECNIHSRLELAVLYLQDKIQLKRYKYEQKEASNN